MYYDIDEELLNKIEKLLRKKIHQFEDYDQRLQTGIGIIKNRQDLVKDRDDIVMQLERLNSIGEIDKKTFDEMKNTIYKIYGNFSTMLNENGKVFLSYDVQKNEHHYYKERLKKTQNELKSSVQEIKTLENLKSQETSPEMISYLEETIKNKRYNISSGLLNFGKLIGIDIKQNVVENGNLRTKTPKELEDEYERVVEHYFDNNKTQSYLNISNEIYQELYNAVCNQYDNIIEAAYRREEQQQTKQTNQSEKIRLESDDKKIYQVHTENKSTQRVDNAYQEPKITTSNLTPEELEEAKKIVEQGRIATPEEASKWRQRQEKQQQQKNTENKPTKQEPEVSPLSEIENKISNIRQISSKIKHASDMRMSFEGTTHRNINEQERSRLVWLHSQCQKEVRKLENLLSKIQQPTEKEASDKLSKTIREYYDKSKEIQYLVHNSQGIPFDRYFAQTNLSQHFEEEMIAEIINRSNEMVVQAKKLEQEKEEKKKELREKAIQEVVKEEMLKEPSIGMPNESEISENETHGKGR